MTKEKLEDYAAYLRTLTPICDSHGCVWGWFLLLKVDDFMIQLPLLEQHFCHQNVFHHIAIEYYHNLNIFIWTSASTTLFLMTPLHHTLGVSLQNTRDVACDLEFGSVLLMSLSYFIFVCVYLSIVSHSLSLEKSISFLTSFSGCIVSEFQWCCRCRLYSLPVSSQCQVSFSCE